MSEYSIRVLYNSVANDPYFSGYILINGEIEYAKRLVRALRTIEGARVRRSRGSVWVQRV